MKQYTIQSTKPENATTLQRSLELAEKTGVLQVPEQALCLTVSGGQIKLEGATDGR